MDNSNLTAKIALRNHFLRLVKRPANVLECFAGVKRELYHACYESDNVTGLDIKSSDKTIKIDNKKFIASADLSKYNFFDLDAYGSPYELLLNIFNHRSGIDGEFVAILTDGMWLRFSVNNQGSNFHQTIIANRSGIKIPALGRHQEFIIKLTLKTLSDKYGIDITECKVVQEDDNRMFYIGMLCSPKNNNSKTNKA